MPRAYEALHKPNSYTENPIATKVPKFVEARRAQRTQRTEGQLGVTPADRL